MGNERIGLQDSMQDIVLKMAEGNPGAITALMGLITAKGGIDPDQLLGPIGTVLSLDTYGIYGSNIYILWNDQCDRNTHKLIMLLRATQMGIFSDVKLRALAGDQMRSEILHDEEWARIVSELNKNLPNFDTNY